MTNQSQASNKSRGISDMLLVSGHLALLFTFLNMANALHDRFDSWQQFQDKLDDFCKQTHQSFVKDDSKTVECVNKHKKLNVKIWIVTVEAE